MDSQLVRIKFVGPTRNKRDNVCRTNTYWPCRGAIRDVSPNIAVQLLNHPTVFVRAGENEVSAELQVPATGTPVINTIKTPPLNTLSLADAGNPENVTPPAQPQAVQPVATTPPATPAVSIPPAQAAEAGVIANAGSREKAIEGAILTLDENDPNAFTSDGAPILSAVSHALGVDVAPDDLISVWDQMVDASQADVAPLPVSEPPTAPAQA
ncbi:MAG: hypothetical protein V3S33_06045 [Gammaproteobacteria bacterium]